MKLLSALFALFQCQHDYGWPRGIEQTCSLCGATRIARVDLRPLPRFAVPKFQPRAVEETGIDRVQREAAEDVAKEILTLEQMYGER